MMNTYKPLIIAHRGASAYLPEHTLAATVYAHASGADYLEQDVVLSKDDVPVVIHDIHLDSISDVALKFPERKRLDGHYYAIDFFFKELKSLNLTERFCPKKQSPIFPKRFDTNLAFMYEFKILSLEEELFLIQELNKTTGKSVGIYPELKNPAFHEQEGKDLTKIVLKLLAKFGYKNYNDKVFLQCFDGRYLQYAKYKLGSTMKMVQLIEDDGSQDHMLTKEGLQHIKTYADVIGPSITDLFEEKESKTHLKRFVSFAKVYGLRLHPYTVRHDALMKPCKSLEELLEKLFFDALVDGVFTDVSDKTLAFLQKHY